MNGKTIVWVGRAISGLATFVFVMSAFMKFRGGPELAEGFAHFGIAESLAWPLGLLETACAILYAIPATAVLGAVLLTGYLGGAILTHLRVGEAVYVQIAIGGLVWLGLYLREPRLKSLLPIRSQSTL